MKPRRWSKCVEEELLRLSPDVAYPRDQIRRGAAKQMWGYGGLGFLEYVGQADTEGRALDRLTEKGRLAREWLMTIDGECRELPAGRPRMPGSMIYVWRDGRWNMRKGRTW